MHELKTKIEGLVRKLAAIKKTLKIDDAKIRVKELEAKTTDPSFWSDQRSAKSVMQELGDIQSEISEVEKIEADLETLAELAQDEKSISEKLEEIKSLEKRIEKLKLKSLLAGAYDVRHAIISIHAGQGGVEAMDWASMLYRMYLRFFERKGWNSQVLDYSAGEEAGIKSVTLRVEGAYAYGYLKGEAGTHRLVRQSPFNADRLRQTSFALVEILPELSESDIPDIEIKDEDLEWQFFRSSSQGGQNVQKVSTAVRLIHKPSGIVVTAQTERFQEQNRKFALDHLRAKLWAKKQEEEAKEKKLLKGDYKPASWGNQIRSYVLHPYKMVKDLRTEVETQNTDRVLDGEIDEFIEAELKSESGS
jgi:peptide chain release factor 2